MEENETKITKEELKIWISEMVQKMDLNHPDVKEQCNLLKSLLEKREKKADLLLKLGNSVSAYEAIVKEQYALLGWEYRDTDSDDDVIEINSDGTNPTSPCDSEVDVCSISPNNCITIPNNNDGDSQVFLPKKAKVVLTRLNKSEIKHLSQKYPENHDTQYCSDDTENYISDQYESDDSADDSDFVVEPLPNKKRRIKIKWPVNCARNTSKRQVDTNTKDAQESSCNSSPITNESVSNAKTVVPEKSSCKSNSMENNPLSNTNPVKKVPANKSNQMAKESGPNVGKATATIPPSPCVENSVCVISTCCQAPEGSLKAPVKKPDAKIEVGMKVLAKKMTMCWQHGKVNKIIQVASDKLKYSVRFHNKAKRLVSAHHLAFSTTTKLEYLYIGARVVVGRMGEDVFRSGIVAELPSRKNQQRFLVFIDDQTALYVGLPHLHLVCTPLENPEDDINNSSHREFIKAYIKVWPCPPHLQCKPGQRLNVEHNGVQKNCVVQLVDCSLMEVFFVENQHKEWLYMGSWRLEHMAKMKELQMSSSS